MNCLECNKEFVPISRVHKFCSQRCRLRFNARKRWLIMRNDPDYKSKIRENSKRWYQKNKTKHNLRMRDYMREYYRKKYSKRAREVESEKKDK